MKCSYDRACPMPDSGFGICHFHATILSGYQYFLTQSIGPNDPRHEPLATPGAPRARKLVHAQVVEIILRRRAGATLKQLAGDYNVSQKLIATTEKRYAAKGATISNEAH